MDVHTQHAEGMWTPATDRTHRTFKFFKKGGENRCSVNGKLAFPIKSADAAASHRVV